MRLDKYIGRKYAHTRLMANIFSFLFCFAVVLIYLFILRAEHFVGNLYAECSARRCELVLVLVGSVAITHLLQNRAHTRHTHTHALTRVDYVICIFINDETTTCRVLTLAIE